MKKRWDEMTGAEKASEDECRIDADWVRRFGMTRATSNLIEATKLSDADRELCSRIQAFTLCNDQEDGLVERTIIILRLIEQGKI